MSQHRPSTLISVVSSCLLLLAVDTALRPFMAHGNGEVYRNPDMPLVYQLRPGHYDRAMTGDLAALLAPEQRNSYHWRIHIDSHGFRNPEPMPRSIDLVVLGDSYGTGAVSDGDSWGSLVARATGRSWYNLSMPGSSPWQEYATWLMEYGRLPLSENAVVIWMLFSGNDLTEFYTDRYRLEDLPFTTPLEATGIRWASWARRSPTVRLARALQGRQTPPVPSAQIGTDEVYFLPGYMEQAKLSADAVRGHPNFSLLLRTVEAMQASVNRDKRQLVIVLAPSKEELYGWALDGATPRWNREPGGLSQALAGADICFLDLKPALVDAALEHYPALLYWPDDTHWNLTGNRVAARSILDYLEVSDACA